MCISARLKIPDYAGASVKLRTPKAMSAVLASRDAIRGFVVAIVFTLTAQVLASKPAPHVPKGIVSDWTQRHVLYPDSQDESVMARFRGDPRWEENRYLRHRETWWPEYHPDAGSPAEDRKRD